MLGRSPTAVLSALLLVVAALALGSPGAVAQQRTAKRLGRDRPDVLLRWRTTLEESEQLLLAGESKQVRKRSNRLLEEMTRRIESGDFAAQYLASGAMQRSLAEAGLGNERDALWDFEMAVALRPDLSQLDLDAYGEAGANLQRYRAEMEDLDVGLAPFWASPPKKVKSPQPEYPRAKVVACLEEAIVVRGVVDADGLLQRPRLPSPNYPVLGFAAMDALRAWRFEPARLDGRKVPARYELTVNYKIKLCSNFLAAGAGGENPAASKPPKQALPP